MRRRSLAVIGFTVLSIGSCSYGASLRASDSGGLRLSRYHTFFVLQGASSGNPVTDQRIRSDVETALNSRGWVDVSRDEAEAVVVAHAATASDRSYEAFYRGWGGWPWKDCPGATGGTMRDYKPGTLVVDIFDAESKEALWSGVAPNAAPANPDMSGRATAQAITKMFRAFPAKEPTGDEALPVREGRLSTADTPRIIFEHDPAVLVQVDGPPEYRKIDGTGLDRVVNARPFIIRDGDGIHYMKIGNGWMQAYTLTGMWSVAGTVPHGAEPALARVIRNTGTAGFDLLDDQGLEVDEGGFTITPAVHVSTTPAALIVTRGEPQFEPVGGTKLLYMKNTAGRVLEEPTDQELYVQVSGEWYRAWTESGPWQRVAAKDLPSDLGTY
jgi:hypothetical protein